MSPKICKGRASKMHEQMPLVAHVARMRQVAEMPGARLAAIFERKCVGSTQIEKILSSMAVQGPTF